MKKYARTDTAEGKRKRQIKIASVQAGDEQASNSSAEKDLEIPRDSKLTMGQQHSIMARN